jgi:DNA-binding transcriptional LysR family regulator
MRAGHAHFGRAATALNIAQPALTESVQALEPELGETLLDRKPGAVTLTAFGELVIQCQKIGIAAHVAGWREVVR